MEPARLVLLAVIVEGGLGAAGLIWMWLMDLPVRGGAPGAALGSGALAACLMAGVGLWLLEGAPAWPAIRQFREVCRRHLAPLFARLEAPHVLAISVMAGLGEEFLFRGALQAQVGLTAASLLFGLAHFGGLRTLGLALWATVAGFVLGGLALLTQGLIAPIVAHALYDALAIAYLRWSAGTADAS